MNIELTRGMAEILLYLRAHPERNIRRRGSNVYLARTEVYRAGTWFYLWREVDNIEALIKCKLLVIERTHVSKYKPCLLSDVGKELPIPPLETLEGDAVVFA